MLYFICFFLVISGESTFFVNIYICKDDVRCTQCHHILGSIMHRYSWITITRFSLTRVSPHSIVSTCLDRQNLTNGEVNSHKHRCNMMTIDQKINDHAIPLQLISHHNGKRLSSPCDQALNFTADTMIYPLRPLTINATTQTENNTNIEERDNSIILSDFITGSSINLRDTVKKSSNVEYICDDVFWETLRNEPSNSRGIHSPASVQRAFAAAERLRNSHSENVSTLIPQTNILNVDNLACENIPNETTDSPKHISHDDVQYPNDTISTENFNNSTVVSTTIALEITPVLSNNTPIDSTADFQTITTLSSVSSTVSFLFYFDYLYIV